MKRKQITWITIVVLFTSFGLWAFLPMTDTGLKIPEKKAMLSSKLNYLNELKLPDSVQTPNLVIIMADDLGKMDISTYNAEGISTPYLDQLAQEGVRFDQAYVTSPICSPSRAGLLTGRNQARFGYDNNIHERYPSNRLEQFVFKHFLATDQWRVADVDAVPVEEEMEKQGIPAEEILLSEVLHRVGYRTGVIGKWHLGYSQLSIPINRGFDYHYGFYEAYSLYQADVEHPDIVNQTCPDFSDKFLWEKGRSGTCAIRQNHVEIPEEGYLTDRIADEAVQFVETNSDTSFFLYVPFSAPHTPFQAQKKYYDQFAHIEDPHKRIYAAMVKNLDDAIGRIMESIHNSGIDSNTMVVFLSDNGGATYTTATDNAPLKGGKLTHFEGGNNVPMLMKWPGVIDSNSEYGQAISATDVFNTFLAHLNLDLPQGREYDGVNLIPYLQKNNPSKPHETLYWRADYLHTVLRGDWKYIEDRLSGSQALYNLAQDPYEKTNLLQEQEELVNELQMKLEQWESQCDDPRWPRVMDFKFNDGEQDFHFPL